MLDVGRLKLIKLLVIMVQNISGSVAVLRGRGKHLGLTDLQSLP